MRLPPFLLDHWLAQHEYADPPIRFNLASSAGPRWTHGQLLDLDSHGVLKGMRDLSVSYAQPDGILALREQIARLHKVDTDHVLVTTGASEALSIMLCLASEPGASVALPKPGYPATEIFAQAWGLKVKYYEISRERGYRMDAGTVMEAVDGSTRLVVVNSPHNPTGAVMSRAEIEKLAGQLDARGIPVIADEVFHHVYFGEQQSTAAGLRNVIQIGDFSKSFSLPGLRIGWVIDADGERRKRILDARSYFTIGSAPLMEAFGIVAMQNADRVLSRLREVTGANLAVLEKFIARHSDVLDWSRPQGGTLAFPWLKNGADSRPLCERFAKAGVLVAPGDCYGMPSYLRIGYGNCEPTDFEQATGILSQVLSRGGT